MSELKIGDFAPNFQSINQSSKLISLSDFKGKWVVLYFYPKDNTTGCTKEACDFRDNQANFTNKNAVILGVSPDNPKSHQKFIENFGLPFTLIADTEKEIAQNYDVWKEKTMCGKTSFGIVRTTFLINPEGKIAKIFDKVKVDKHAQEVLNAIS